MNKPHVYSAVTVWTGNRGTGTSNYRAYGREHEISGEGKSAPIAGSSTPAFRGDGSRYNPEELLVAALSACHMLQFLHLCSESGITVQSYRDEATGTMTVHADGSGRFTEVVLRPRVEIEQTQRAGDLAQKHERAHELCFIASSVNFPVRCEPAS